jgi:MFS family permease
LTHFPQNLSSDQPADLRPLFWAGFCFWTSLASLLPTLPLYIRDIGGNGHQVGFVMGAFAIGLLGSRAWVGRLADERSRKIVLLLGMGVAAIAPIGYALFEQVWILVAFRAFHGISIAAFGTAYSALVADLSPPGQRGRMMGTMSLVQPLGVAIGPAIGGLMQAQVGYIPLFALSALLAMLGFVFTLRVYDPMAVKADGSQSEPQPISPNKAQSVWQIVWSPRLRVPTIVMLLVGLAFGLISSYVPLYMRQTVSHLNAGVFYTAAAIASFSLRMSVGKASDRLGRGIFITFGLVCYLLAMVLLWQARSEFSFIGAGLLEGCGGGILIPMMATLMADRSHAAERGQVFSLCMAGFDLGIAIAGPVFGILATEGNYGQLFGMGGICVGVGLVLFLTCSSKSLRYSLAFALGRGRDVYALQGLRS